LKQRCFAWQRATYDVKGNVTQVVLSTVTVMVDGHQPSEPFAVVQPKVASIKLAGNMALQE
jgi:hypothetical protein